jgi:acetyl-CoA carboxylase carboxyl transferase subunit beta
MGADAAGERRSHRRLWIKCLGCRQTIFKAELEANLNVCPKCQHHFKIGARQRIELLLEPGYELVDGGLRSTDPLNFTDVKPYKQRLRRRRRQPAWTTPS